MCAFLCVFVCYAQYNYSWIWDLASICGAIDLPVHQKTNLLFTPFAFLFLFLFFTELETDEIVGMGEFGIVVAVSAINTTASSGSLSSSSSTFSPYEEDSGNINNNNCSSNHSMRDSFRTQSRSCTALHSMCSSYASNAPIGSDDANDSANNNNNNNSGNNTHLDQQPFLRSKIVESVRQNASCDRSIFRYAVKQLRKDLYPQQKSEAAKDLAKEAKFLASLQHPNVVALRGTVSQPGRADFMILLDRLQKTLGELAVDWNENRPTTLSRLIPWPSQQQESLLTKRLLALYDVLQAMRYLHNQS